MKHWLYQRQLNKYLIGSLSEQKKQMFEQHLASCAICREKLEMEQRFHQRITAALQPLNPSPAAQQRVHQMIFGLKPLPPPLQSARQITPLKFNRQLQYSAIAAMIIVGILYFWSILTAPSLTPIQVSKILGEGISFKSGQPQRIQKIDQQSTLLPGDILSTDDYSQALVNLNNISQVWLNRSSQLTFGKNPSTAIKLQQGEIYIAVAKPVRRFQVSTPFGNIRVTGTEFQVNVDTSQLKTTVTCVKGKTEFSNEYGTVIVPSGMQSFTKPEAPPIDPISIDIDPYLQWKELFDKYGKQANILGPDWVPVYWYSKPYPGFKNPFGPANPYSGKIVNTSDELYTTDLQEGKWFEAQGYDYNGIPFYVSRIRVPYSVPVYRVYHLYTDPRYGVVSTHYIVGSPLEMPDVYRMGWKLDKIIGYLYHYDTSSQYYPEGVTAVAQFKQNSFTAHHIHILAHSEQEERLRNNSDYTFQGFGNVYKIYTSPDGKLPTPQKLVPINGDELTDATVTLYWSPVSNTREYEVQVCRTILFNDAILSKIVTVPGAMFKLDPGTWYWRVRTRSKFGIWGEFEKRNDPEYYSFIIKS
jgi:hypothetical protein